MDKIFWHSLSEEEILKKLETKETGIDRAEAKTRLLKFGPNKLPEGKKRGIISIFFSQFKSPLIYILIIAAIIVLYLGETTDALFILFILLFNAVVGTIQEGKAQNTLASLKNLVKTEAIVRREGIEEEIDAQTLVPGDIILISEGNKIPADCRVIEAVNLRADEASLTGESVPVNKTDELIEKEDLPLFERKNMGFLGTVIVAGRGIAVVTATGVNTEIGKIGQAITEVNTEIPLKKDIENLSKIIVLTVLGISALLFTLGIFLGKPVKEMFATVVSLVVSIVPEGLPIVVTLVLATGVWRMSKRNVLVKKLQAVEALGQAKVIAVDKTGTVTKNEMMVKKVFVDNKMFEVSGEGYNLAGEFSLNREKINLADNPELILSGKIATLCANARIHKREKGQEIVASGDPTEVSMMVLGHKLGFSTEALDREYRRINELPFDYKFRYHAVFYRDKNKKPFFSENKSGGGDEMLFVITGAPEVLLGSSDSLIINDKIELLTEEKKRTIEEIFLDASKNGFRVIAGAFAELDQNKEKVLPILPKLIFTCLYLIQDTIRPEAKEAVITAEKAGINVVMITGDHPLTATFIAKEINIFRDGDETITGRELDVISDEELDKRLEKIKVFARVTPEHKIKIIRAFQRKKLIIAMTGDGVNDALSLVAADLGVAMGKIGTEVAKEAADIILLDDNFGSIVAAAEEGRSIYKTIKKVTLYLFSTSFGEVFTIGGAILIGLPLPILPAQIIWLNLVTDGFLDVSLAMEAKEHKLLERKWKKPGKYLINDKITLQRMLLMSVPMAFFTLLLFPNYLYDLDKARTVALTLLAVFQWFNAWNCRSEEKSIFQKNPFSNKYLIAATITIITLHLLAVYNPFMQNLLQTVPLNFYDWLLILVLALPIILIEELRKLFHRAYLKLKGQNG